MSTGERNYLVGFEELSPTDRHLLSGVLGKFGVSVVLHCDGQETTQSNEPEVDHTPVFKADFIKFCVEQGIVKSVPSRFWSVLSRIDNNYRRVQEDITSGNEEIYLPSGELPWRYSTAIQQAFVSEMFIKPDVMSLEKLAEELKTGRLLGVSNIGEKGVALRKIMWMPIFQSRYLLHKS